MGIDVRVCIEYRMKADDPADPWDWEMWAYVPISQMATAASRLLGVIDKEAVPVAPRRGLPDDMAMRTKWIVEEEQPNLHVPSWLTREEFAAGIEPAWLPFQAIADAMARLESDGEDETRLVLWLDSMPLVVL